MESQTRLSYFFVKPIFPNFATVSFLQAVFSVVLLQPM